MEISKRIQMLRKENSLSQEELASRLQVSRQAVSKWESGQSKPEITNIVAMAKTFGVTTDYILTGENSTDDSCEKGILNSNYFVPISLIIVGAVLSFLLPLLSELYKGYCFEKWGNCFTEAYVYIFRFPILGVTMIALLCIVIGMLKFWKRFIKIRKNRERI